jgi:uncharacterized coiled-coil protein SlyX
MGYEDERSIRQLRDAIEELRRMMAENRKIIDDLRQRLECARTTQSKKPKKPAST